MSISQISIFASLFFVSEIASHVPRPKSPPPPALSSRPLQGSNICSINVSVYVNEARFCDCLARKQWLPAVFIHGSIFHFQKSCPVPWGLCFASLERIINSKVDQCLEMLPLFKISKNESISLNFFRKYFIPH